MNVLHVLPFPGVGGTEVATRRLADAVRPFDVGSSALLLRPAEDLQAYLEGAGIPCLVPAVRPEPSLLRAAPRFLHESWTLARTLRAFDLIHCADVSAAYSVAVAGRLARRPVLCHIRNREARLPLRSRLFIGAAGHFVFVSRDTRDRFPMPGLARTRTSILYDGVDIPPSPSGAERQAAAAALRAEFGLAADAVIAAMFARVNPQKDYPTLVRAAALLRDSHPRLRFLIVGDKDRVPQNRAHFAEVEALARAAGVLDRFVFTGFREDIRHLMLAADLCLLCTHFEGLPLVLIEAMALGQPCIATAVDGIPEALTDGVTGLLHAPGDAEGLAAAIVRLADSPALALTIGEAARRDAEDRFSRDRFARDAHALYAKLAGPEGKGRQGLEAARAALG